ncbi:MAG: PIG-L family deacetylase [Verrucomicrobiota bacterium]
MVKWVEAALGCGSLGGVVPRLDSDACNWRRRLLSLPAMANTRVALAVAAHPDDIEFGMAGTLLLLRRAGWQIHSLNLASGNCGSNQHQAAATRRIRRAEAQSAARVLGATFHPSFLDDLEIFYADAPLRKLAAIIRRVRPTVLLTHSPEDYMEDHVTTARLAVTAAFARGMPNYRTRPPRPPTDQAVTVYHGMPHGLKTALRQPVIPGVFIDTCSVHEAKRRALACHRSQKDWLDVSQGMDSYLRAMDEMSIAVGKLSGTFKHAEGWRRHSHLGFCGPEDDPLRDALAEDYAVNRRYERALAWNLSPIRSA